MKTAGIIILVMGILMTIYSGFTYVTKDKVVDLGSLEITKDNEHAVNWQPYAGIIAIVIGGTLLVAGRNKPLTL